MGVMPASAGTPKPQPAGAVACGLTGAMTFKPGIPSAAADPAPGRVKVKLTAQAVDCVGTDLVNVKAPITGGKVTLTTTIPEESATCADLPSPPDLTGMENSRFKVQWQGLNPSGRPMTVANVKTTLWDYTDILRGWQLVSDSLPDEKPFAGAEIVMDLVFDNLGDVGACLLGGPDLLSVHFSAAGGSRITMA